MPTISRIGFGQLEPNHLSAQRNGQVYGQLPCNKDIKVLENGQFVKYDYAKGEVNFEGAGEWMLVYNEVKLYDDFWRESYKDFALVPERYDRGEMVPRVLKTMPGDIFTTNTIKAATLKVTDKLAPGADGYLAPTEATDGMIWQVVKVYTMPDGQKGVKVMRIA